MGLVADVRYAIRTLAKSPGFAAVAVLALAFGIGVNSAIFTLLNAITLRPVPVRDAAEVVTVYQVSQGQRSRNVHGSRAYLSYPEYAAYRDQNHVFSGLSAYAVAPLTLGGTAARRVQGFLVTCNYFSVLPEPLTMGRGFLDEECGAPGGNPVAVVSHGLWQQHFNSDPAILGRTVLLNRTTFTIVGVGPKGFVGTSLFSADLWGPISMVEQWKPGRGGMLDQADLSWLEVAGRLRPGVSLAQARADLAVIAGRIDQLTPGRQTRLVVDRATLMNNPEGRTPVFAVGAVVLAAVSLVLLIACANLANLLLARGVARKKEIAVRLAVGASRLRLIRQLVTESLLLAIAGGALGLLAAWWVLRGTVPLLMAKLPQDAPSVVLNLTPDLRILLYSLAVSFVTALAFGLLPAMQASKVDISSELKSGAAGDGRSQGWMRSALVTAQVAVCIVLLVAAGLLARGLHAAQTIDPGLDLEGVTVASFDLRLQGYDAPRSALFHRQLSERLGMLAGIQSVAATDEAPLSGGRSETEARAEGRDQPVRVTHARVSTGFLATLGIPIVLGRGFEPRDTQSETRVAVVNESMARLVWPNQNPVGQRLVFGGDTQPLEVIGVTKDVRYTSLSQMDPAFVFLPATPAHQMELSVVVRAAGGFAATERAIREQARAIDPGVLVQTSRLSDNPELFKLPSQITATGALGIGLVGLMLASIGIYGVMSYAVARRTREIGIRMTLGAEQRDVAGMILRQSMRPVAIGIAIGLAGSAAVSRVLSSLLFGVSPLDPVVFAGVAAFLGVVAGVASMVPARRAMRVDPMTALRES